MKAIRLKLLESRNTRCQIEFISSFAREVSAIIKSRIVQFSSRWRFIFLNRRRRIFFHVKSFRFINDSRDFLFVSNSTFDHIIIHSCTRTFSTQLSQYIRHIWILRDKLHTYIYKSVATLFDYFFIYFTLFKLVFIFVLISHSSLNIVYDNKKCLFLKF